MQSSKADIEALGGRTALVTGGAKRLGRATALALGREGMNVVVHYRSSQDEAQAVKEELLAMGVKAWTLDADLEDLEAAGVLVARANEMAGPIDVLVNNASVFPSNDIADATPEDFLLNIRVNALAPFVIAREFAAQERCRAIINFLDTRVVGVDRKHAAYHVSKRVLFTLTRMMALEFAPGVRVNAVAPGLILPPEGHDEAYLQQLAGTNPLESVGTVSGVAEAVIFLLKSAFITGQVVFVDGGRHLKENLYGV